MHPLLFAAYPIVFLYARNVDAVRVATTLRPLAFVFLGAATLFYVLKFFLRDNQRAALLCSMALLLFFSYGHLYHAMHGTVRHRLLLPAIALLWMGAFIAAAKTSAEADTLTRAANVFALVLIAFPFAEIAIPNAEGGSGELSAAMSLEDEQAARNAPGPGSGTPRDIYYIILDSYVGPTAMKDVYNFDNGAFLNFLSQQGFYVADRSTSNYSHTLVSIPSSLSFDYVDTLADSMGDDSTNRAPLKALIADSRIVNQLKQRGYEFVAFGSGSETTEHYSNADVVLRPPRDVSEFERTLIYGTMFPTVQDFLVRYNVLDPGTLGLWNFDEWRARIRFTIEGLGNLAPSDTPRFIFAHILDPHPPFVFNRDGGRTIKPDPFEAYVDEVMFLNDQLRGMLTAILSKPGPAPIIILQADHGFVPPDAPLPEDTVLRGRFEILNAYYLPDGAASFLYDSISPVNTFRVILNHYFGMDYELRPDRSFYSTTEHPYDLSEVTETLQLPVEQSVGGPSRERF